MARLVKFLPGVVGRLAVSTGEKVLGISDLGSAA